MTRPPLLWAGLALLAALWLAPLSAWLGDFPGHMLRHMGLVAVVPPLLVLGAPGVAQRAAVPVLAAAVAEFVVVWGWHLPALHGMADGAALPRLVEHASFLTVGLAVWAGALCGPPLAGAGGLLLTSMHMTLLGAIVILAPQDLYAAICGREPDLSGQQLGGVLMLAIGTPVYLLGGLWLTGRTLREQPQ